MAAILELPTNTRNRLEDKTVLSEAIETLLAPALEERNIQQIGWWITDGFFQGMRQFEIVNYELGQVEVSYEDEDGAVHLRWDEPMTRLQTEVGRLARLDTSPLAKKRAHSLESLRNASLSQVILDYVLADGSPDLLKIRYFTGLCMYGTYGIASWPDVNAESPLAHTPELIPPWELLSVPARYSNPTDRRAVIRSRLFPLIQLRRMEGVSLPADEELLDVVELPYGSDATSSGPYENGPGFAGAAGGVQAGSFHSLFDKSYLRGQRPGAKGEDRRPGKDTEQYVILREIYVDGPRSTVARYIARAGRAIVKDFDFMRLGMKIPRAIGISRYQDTGRFYGRSFASKIIPFALELERLLERLIANAADMDRFGFLMVPNSLGINLEDFKATESPRVIPYEPDLASPTPVRAETLQPTTATDIPGRIMQFGVQLLDRIVSQGPSYSGQAAGRGDSGVFLSTLAETGSTHLLPVAVQIEDAYVTMYRAILHNVGIAARRSPAFLAKGLELTRIENSIAGVTIDPQTGRLILEADQLPDPWSVNLNIRSSDPLSSERERQEAVQLLGQGILEPLEFYIMNYRDGWGYPVGHRDVWENYVKAVLVNLIMFNDGETPGELPQGVYFNETADKPEVHLRALEEFIAGPEFALASTEVQDAFNERWRLLQSRLGNLLPEGMPHLEQAAMQAAGGQQQGPGPARQSMQGVA